MYLKRAILTACLSAALLAAAAALAVDPVLFRNRIEAGAIEQARDWLDRGLAPDFAGDRIGSGLMIAAWEGNLPMMELFVSRGANVNQRNALGETALMHAAWKGRPEAVRWLLAHGAEVNGPSAHWSALHYAAFAGHLDIARLLLARGADIDARIPNGSSVLMMAIYDGHADMARWLIGQGADVRVRNENGDGALAWAMKFGREELAPLIGSAADIAQAKAQIAQAAPTPSAARRSEALPPEMADLLNIRALLAERGLSVAPVDRGIAALRARYAKREPTSATAEKPRAKSLLLEITALRAAPQKQTLQLLPLENRP